jgi:hypothetical protein
MNLKFSIYIRRCTTLIWVLTPFVIVSIASSCEVEDPVKEEVPELITTVRLTFVPASGGSPVIVIAMDPDGEGVQDIEIEEPVNLMSATSYTLEITLINGLADPTQPEYDVTEEVREEADEHAFYFSWTGNLFSSPIGDGNADNAGDDVNYLDADANGLPLGIETAWITGISTTGELRIILKHQPDLKSEHATAQTGETDLDVTFPVTIE